MQQLRVQIAFVLGVSFGAWVETKKGINHIGESLGTARRVGDLAPVGIAECDAYFTIFL